MFLSWCYIWFWLVKSRLGGSLNEKLFMCMCASIVYPDVHKITEGKTQTWSKWLGHLFALKPQLNSFWLTMDRDENQNMHERLHCFVEWLFSGLFELLNVHKLNLTFKSVPFSKVASIVCLSVCLFHSFVMLGILGSGRLSGAGGLSLHFVWKKQAGNWGRGHLRLHLSISIYLSWLRILCTF